MFIALSLHETNDIFVRWIFIWK